MGKKEVASLLKTPCATKTLHPPELQKKVAKRRRRPVHVVARKLFDGEADGNQVITSESSEWLEKEKKYKADWYNSTIVEFTTQLEELENELCNCGNQEHGLRVQTHITCVKNLLESLKFLRIFHA